MLSSRSSQARSQMAALTPRRGRCSRTCQKLTLAFTPRTAARSTLGGFHLWSDFWYKRSNMYRHWRSRRDVSNAITRIVGALDDRHLVAGH